MTEFRRAPRAITKAGQIKGCGGRHEKNDATRIDDRSNYVLGWTNERKIEALLSRAAALQQRQNLLAADQEKHVTAWTRPSARARCSPGWPRPTSSPRSTGNRWSTGSRT